MSLLSAQLFLLSPLQVVGDHQAEWQRFKGLQLALLLAVSVLASPHNQVTFKPYFCYLVQDPVPCTVWSNNTETKFGAERVLLKGHTKRINEPPNPNSPKDFSKAFLKAKWGRGVIGCCRLLGVGMLCSFSCPCRSSHHIPVNLHQDKYSLFCNYLSLYEQKSVIPLKVREPWE